VEQYKICLDTFPKTYVMSIVDFAKNYTHQEYNEVQEMHCHSFQLTILVHICYRWNKDYLVNRYLNKEKLIIEYHYYLSNDNEHDTLFVQHCFELHWVHLMQCGLFPNEHIVWSNNVQCSLSQGGHGTTWPCKFISLQFHVFVKTFLQNYVF